jgi:hypothetical protein
MNPLSPPTYARTVLASTFWLAPMFLLVGGVTNVYARDVGPGFFELRVRLGADDGPGAPFWLVALCAVYVGHGYAVKRFAYAGGTVTRDPSAWFGVFVPFPAIALLAADIVMCALVPPTFFVLRNSTFCH